MFNQVRKEVKVKGLILYMALLGCVVPDNVVPIRPGLRPDLDRARIVRERTTPIPVTAAFDPQAASHPSGGWSVGFLLDAAKVERMSELVWKVRIKMTNGPFPAEQYPRIVNGMLEVPVFRMRHSPQYRRQECITQTFTGIALQPGFEAEFVLDVSKFTDSRDSVIFEHYTGYTVYLDAYDAAGTKRPLNGTEGVYAGPTPYIPERLQSVTALVGCG